MNKTENSCISITTNFHSLVREFKKKEIAQINYQYIIFHLKKNDNKIKKKLIRIIR